MNRITIDETIGDVVMQNTTATCLDYTCIEMEKPVKVVTEICEISSIFLFFMVFF